MTLEELGIPNAIYLILRRSGIDTYEQLKGMKDYQLVKLPRMGVKKLDVLRKILREVEHGNMP